MSSRAKAVSAPIYDLLLDAMRHRALSQREAAEELGVSRQLLHSWLVARNLPSEQYVPELARFLKRTPASVEQSITRARRVNRMAELERITRELAERIETITERLEYVERCLDTPKRSRRSAPAQG